MVRITFQREVIMGVNDRKTINQELFYRWTRAVVTHALFIVIFTVAAAILKTLI
jgi:hypothetical protein